MKFTGVEFPEFGPSFDFAESFNKVVSEAFRLWTSGQHLNSLRLLNALSRRAGRPPTVLLRGLQYLGGNRIVTPVLVQGKLLRELGDLEGAYTAFAHVERFGGVGKEEARESIQELRRAFREVSDRSPRIEYARRISPEELEFTTMLFQEGQSTPALRLYNLVHETAQSRGRIIEDPPNVRAMLEPLETRVLDEGRFLLDIGETVDSLGSFEEVKKFGKRHAGTASEFLSLANEALRQDPALDRRSDLWITSDMRLDPRSSEPTVTTQAPSVTQKTENASTDSESKEPRPANQILRRTPHMDLNAQGGLKPGAEFLITIYTDKQPQRMGEQTADIELQAPADLKRFELEVFLSVSSHFIPNNQAGSIVIERDRDESSRLTFQLQVSIDAQPGKGTITAYFTYERRPSGHVSRQVQIAADAKETTVPAGSPPNHCGSVQVAIEQRQPDLTLDIWEHEDRDKKKFFCRVTSPWLPDFDSRPKAWKLDDEAPKLVEGFMNLFTSKVPNPDSTVSDLRGAGIELYKAAPTNFHDAFWQLADSGREFRSILVVTQEPVMPWELMLPYRGTINAGNREEREFPLGVEFAVGRWIREGPPGQDAEADLTAHVAPPQKIGLSDSYGIAPDAVTKKPLVYALAEVEMVIKRVPGKKIDPATFKQIDTDLAAEGRSLVHFACHGATGTSVAQVILLDGHEKLNSVGVKQIKGFKAAFRARRPLVFLNACEVGRGVPALVGVGGFAAAFIELGASGVISPLWSVKDDIAHGIACSFYEQITTNPAIEFAAVFQQLRKRAYESGDDTYAAYCFYGDPLARQ